MEKVRFAIIGCGNQGSHYATQLFEKGKIENGELVAICDNKQARVDTLNGKLAKKVAEFNDYNDLIKSNTVDAVIICTPHKDHPQIAMAALKGGIHTLCDKPAGVYTKQVREMNAVAKSSTAKFAMMFNQRTNCVYRKMREIILGGELGELQRVTWIITDWFRTQSYYDNGSWRATWAGEGGGVLINQCPHQIDLVQWVIGQLPKKVNAFCHYGKWHDIEVEDDVTAYFEYENGATGIFVTTTGEAPGENRFTVSGSKGRLVCEGEQLLWYKNAQDSIEVCKTSENGFAAPECQKIVVETDGSNLQHAGIINNFANAILGIEPLFVEGTDGIDNVELMNAIELSGWKNGAAVSLPVDEDEYLSELQKRCKTSRTKEEKEFVIADMGGTFGRKTK